MKLVLYILLFTGCNAAFSQSFSVGLIADCQYCNCEYSERWNNDYKKALPRLMEAVQTFNDQNVDLAIHLGDFIDRDFESFEEVSPIFNQLNMPHYHVLGNHDFSVADSLKTSVPKLLGLEQLYYTIQKQDWLLIVLDGTDISLYKTNDSVFLNQAENIRLSYELEGREQAKPWNGAIGNKQLKWLEKQLKTADKKNLKVLVFCHFPILPKSSANLWNDVELISVLEKHTSVKAYINGHHHPGNYAIKKGIHYLTLQAMVRTKTANAYAIITVEKNKIVVQGFGREPDRTLKF